MKPSPHDRIFWRVRGLVEKFDGDQTRWAVRRSGLSAPDGSALLALGLRPEVVETEGNLITTAGLTRQVSLMNGAGGQALTNTATRLGTGNGAGSAAVGDTDLGAAAGAANRWFQVMDATFPSVAAAVLTAKATFATGDGNYAWNEWGLDIGTPTVTSSATVNAVLFNHKTSAALGTKTAGSTWAFTVTITQS